MAGAFINGPITPPNLRVEQIFQLREPLVPDSGLPVVVIGLNRQVVFEESIGAYDGALVDLTLASLATYSATLVELDALSYKDDTTGEIEVTPSLPNVVFRHPQFGDSTIPKKTGSVDGWTFTQATGEFTLDASLQFPYTIASGTGDYTATAMSTALAVDTDAGLRDFTDSSADFIGAGVVAGDTLKSASGDFEIMQVVNETTLVIKDLPSNAIPFTADGTDLAYTIEKIVTDGGTVYVSYVANRADMANRLIAVERDTVEEIFGQESLLDPLGFYVRMALKNTNTVVYALQVSSDDLAGHTDALTVLETSEVPYDLVPLTQDVDILSDYIAHVNLMSTSDKAKERRVFTNYALELYETKVRQSSNFAAFGLGGGASNHDTAGTATVRVLAGQNNLHVLGVQQGDVFRDKTSGGEARIISVTPAGPAIDAAVDLVLATPNTWPLFGTYAHDSLNFSAAAAQVVGCEFDVEATVATDTISITLDGTVHTFEAVAVPAAPDEFLAGAGGNASLFTKLTAYFGDRLNITHGGGAAPVEVREVLGGYGTVLGPAVAATGAATVEDVGGGGAVVTMVATGITPGVKANDTFTLDDDTIPVTTFTFKNDRTTPNGSLLGANNYAVQIGGPVLSALEICDLVAAAINAAGLDVTATVDTALADVVVTSNHTGVLGGVIITAVTAPVTIVNVVAGTGATNGSTIADWEITTKTLTVDEQATWVAQKARDTANRRVLNVWPDICDERFEDLSAGEQLQQQGYGIFSGRTVVMQNVAAYGCGVMAAAARSNLLAADPLTKRPLIGPYDLHRIDEYFNQTQLDRILSTGNMLMEQLQGAGGTVQAVRGVTTDTSDLKVVEENVGAAVDKFTRLVRQATRSLFGPNVIDPDGNFFELFSTKVQAVITRMTRRETREARDIRIVRVYENPDRKDSVIMEVVFTPLFGANDGIVKIYI